MTDTPAKFAKTAIDQMYAGLERSLRKGAIFLKEKDLAESVALDWRLAPDMFPMKKQVQIATELPARSLSRLAGAPIPEFGGDAVSFGDLYGFVEKAREIVGGLSDEAIEADPDGDIILPSPRGERTFKRRVLLQNFIVPNVYFHVMATYLNLRNMGVDVGKMDYLAAPDE